MKHGKCFQIIVRNPRAQIARVHLDAVQKGCRNLLRNRHLQLFKKLGDNRCAGTYNLVNHDIVRNIRNPGVMVDAHKLLAVHIGKIRVVLLAVDVDDDGILVNLVHLLSRQGVDFKDVHHHADVDLVHSAEIANRRLHPLGLQEILDAVGRRKRIRIRIVMGLDVNLPLFCKFHQLLKSFFHSQKSPRPGRRLSSHLIAHRIMITWNRGRIKTVPPFHRPNGTNPVRFSRNGSILRKKDLVFVENDGLTPTISCGMLRTSEEHLASDGSCGSNHSEVKCERQPPCCR